jgi:hypothetical protein
MKQFLTCLLQVAEVLNAELSATKQAGYWLALHDLGLDVFEAACLAVMKREHFFPAPVVFRAYARAYVVQQRARLAERQSAQQLLALRETLVPAEEVAALIAGIWKDGPGAPRLS